MSKSKTETSGRLKFVKYHLADGEGYYLHVYEGGKLVVPDVVDHPVKPETILKFQAALEYDKQLQAPRKKAEQARKQRELANQAVAKADEELAIAVKKAQSKKLPVFGDWQPKNSLAPKLAKPVRTTSHVQA